MKKTQHAWSPPIYSIFDPHKSTLGPPSQRESDNEGLEVE